VSIAIDLKMQNVKDLAEMARKKGVLGWHGMRKDQLIHALAKLRRAKAKKVAMPVAKTNSAGKCNGTAKSHAVVLNGKSHTNGKAPVEGKATNGKVVANGKLPANGKVTVAARPATSLKTSSNGRTEVAVKTNGMAKAVDLTKRNGSNGSHNGHLSAPVKAAAAAAAKRRSPRLERRLKSIRAKLAEIKDLAYRSVVEGTHHTKDRVVIIVRDPYWLQVYWELTRSSLERARVAMGQNWHGARPILRLHEVTADGTTSSARRVVRHVEIHGCVNTWYIDVKDPPKCYQVDVGYLAVNGQFYSLARSNVVSTPQVVPGQKLDHNWTPVAKDFDRIYAMSGGYGHENSSEELREVFEEHLQRPINQRFGFGLPTNEANKDQPFNLEVDAELIIFGASDPDVQVSLRGQPVKLNPDGSFMVRFNMPDRRQVFPIIASRGEGGPQRTIVLAVERNTKIMEPVVRESGE